MLWAGGQSFCCRRKSNFRQKELPRWSVTLSHFIGMFHRNSHRFLRSFTFFDSPLEYYFTYAELGTHIDIHHDSLFPPRDALSRSPPSQRHGGESRRRKKVEAKKSFSSTKNKPKHKAKHTATVELFVKRKPQKTDIRSFRSLLWRASRTTIFCFKILPKGCEQRIIYRLQEVAKQCKNQPNHQIERV
jgi:hypothetical protein